MSFIIWEKQASRREAQTTINSLSYQLTSGFGLFNKWAVYLRFLEDLPETDGGLVNCPSYCYPQGHHDSKGAAGFRRGGEENWQEKCWTKSSRVSQWSVPRQCFSLWLEPDYSIILLICANKNNDNFLSKSPVGTLQLITANQWALWEALLVNSP